MGNCFKKKNKPVYFDDDIIDDDDDNQNEEYMYVYNKHNFNIIESNFNSNSNYNFYKPYHSYLKEPLLTYN